MMLKALVRELITSGPVLHAWRFFRPPFPTILNLHRFAYPDGSGDPTGEALSGEVLRAQLAALRKLGCALVPLSNLSYADAARSSGRPTVAVTIDDGYDDFHAIGAPIFAEFDCPVSVFLVTGFLDGSNWCWWDQLTYVFLHTDRESFTVEIDDMIVPVTCRSRAERLDASRRINPMLERISDEQKWAAIDSIARTADVAIPARPPSWCRPMSWDAVRSWAAKGVRFGPHTVTHPILKQTSDEQCRYEMAHSWQRLQEEVPGAEAVFAYPNGKHFAAGDREATIARDIGMTAALSTERRCIQPTDLDFSRDELGVYRLPRQAWPESVPGLLQVVHGLEDIKRDLFGPRVRQEPV